jgi:2-polyprenyl-3-methyl-5-hydroxy-6-metoxy-1,4-benzoquinol methylase
MKQEEEKDDANVTWEDQNNINAFSKFNSKWSDLEIKFEELNVHPINSYLLRFRKKRNIWTI